tara:strand:+ start:247 stop:1530 length:1284 start_codon:yes stop_codon:yes gene_type:complete
MDINEVEEMLSPSEVDEYGQVKPEYSNFNSAKGLTGLIATAAIGSGLLAKYGKRAAARGIDTFGFGNVPTSYGQESKIAQFTNNLLSAGGGKRRSMPLEFMKSLKASGNPVELKAMDTSLELVEEYMSKLKSQGKRIPKAVSNYYSNLLKMKPERQMAQAVLQTSFKQPISFEHGGKFIKGGFPQNDADIAKALVDKGANIKNPITQFDVSNDKFMVSKLRAASTGDPRLKTISDLLKQNRVNDARRIARTGQFIYNGKLVKGGRPLKLVKEGNNWVAKYVPHYVKRGGVLEPVKEYVVGGHTQKTTFSERAGKGRGFHKLKTNMFDITTYRSAGETLAKTEGLKQKARVLLAGPAGQKLGIHEPVVTTAEYKHRAPGGGRRAGSTDIAKRKLRKFVEASAKTYTKKGKSIPWKSLAKFLLTKGRRF